MYRRTLPWLALCALSSLPLAYAVGNPPAAAVAAAVPHLDEAGFKKVMEGYKGQVVVVNFWATWCGPCKEEMPDLVKFAEANKGKGVVVVGISMDDLTDEAKVAAFTRDQKMSFPSYLATFADTQAFVAGLDPNWPGALPATFVFDRSGKKVFGHTGKITPADLEAALAKAGGAKAPTP